MAHVHGGNIYGKDVEIDFSANLNPLGMPEEVRLAAVRGIEHSERYPDVECRNLRYSVSCMEQVAESKLIFGNGAAELIYALVQSVRPQKALLVTPGFAEYEEALTAVGTKIMYYPCSEEQGFRILPDYLQKLTEDLDLVFLCNPNNPTGIPVPWDILKKTVDICHQKGILLAVDECFNGLWPRGDGQSVKSCIDQVPELFVLRAFTKLFSMAGLRLGYGICGDPRLLMKMRRILQPWNISIPAQEAGAAACQITDYPEKTRRYVERELNFLKNGLAELKLKFWESEANYLFFKGPEDLWERCLEEGILIRSCSNYRGLKKGYFRVAVRTRQENERLLKVLKKILHDPAVVK